jgi:hypothetical protein
MHGHESQFTRTAAANNAAIGHSGLEHLPVPESGDGHLALAMAVLGTARLQACLIRSTVPAIFMTHTTIYHSSAPPRRLGSSHHPVT